MVYGFGGMPLVGSVDVIGHVRAVALAESDVEVQTLAAATAAQLSVAEGEDGSGLPTTTTTALASPVAQVSVVAFKASGLWDGVRGEAGYLGLRVASYSHLLLALPDSYS